MGSPEAKAEKVREPKISPRNGRWLELPSAGFGLLIAFDLKLKRVGLPKHLIRHLATMAELKRAGRYDRMADGVERVTGRPAIQPREVQLPSCRPDFHLARLLQTS